MFGCECHAQLFGELTGSGTPFPCHPERSEESRTALKMTPHPFTPFPSSLSLGEREEGEGSWGAG